jgi:hypothetical protein
LIILVFTPRRTSLTFLSTQGYSAEQALLSGKDNVLPRLTLRRDQQEDSSERQIDYSGIHATLRSQRQRRKIC